MKKSSIRIISMLLLIPMLFGMVFGNVVWAAASSPTIKLPEQPQKLLTQPTLSVEQSKTSLPEVDSSASAWAVPNIKQAYEYGLTYPDIMEDFTRPITREEFCTIVVKLYQKLANQTVTAGSSPFNDTANPEIIKAYQLEIVKGTGAGKFSPNLNITRQEICVMLFRALDKAITGLDKSTEVDFPFEDQNNIATWALNAMKYAYKNSIMNGVGNNKIDPLSNTTREQAITLVKRTYEAFMVKDSGNKGLDKIKPIPGVLIPGGKDGKITIPEVDDSTGLGKIPVIPSLTIPENLGKGKIAIPGTGKTVDIIEGTVLVGQKQYPEYIPTDNDLTLEDFNSLLAIPRYDTRIELYTATGTDKPVIRPKLSTKGEDRLYQVAANPLVTYTAPATSFDMKSIYSKANCAALVDQNGEKKRWFAYNLKNAPEATKVVWQVSGAPFTGFKENWKAPAGLLKSGEVSVQTGEFVIDFSAFASGQSNSGSYTIGANGQLTWGEYGKYKEIPKTQKKYYIRAVPVDSTGNCIGNPGDGLAVLYGKAITASSAKTKTISPSFELWTPTWIGEPSHHPVEFPNLMEHKAETSFSCGEKTPRYFMFKGLDAESTKVVMQVAMKPFTGKASDWESPEGLVYSKHYDELPVTTFCSGEWENTVPISFTEFAPPDSALKPGDKIPYYVRAVAVKQSGAAGSISVAFSETMTVSYSKQQPVKWLTAQTVTVKSYTPTVKILRYQPIKAANQSWEHYYVAYRAPKWNEINCKWRNVNTGETLYPYINYYINDTSITTAKYENEIIPKVIVKGTRVSIFPKEDNKSWWEDLWDGIVSFFESLVDIAKNVANWASNAYASLKEGLINFVVNSIPGIPDSIRGALKMALEGLVNAGLMALGLPPTLPNFDKLSEMGLEYMAEIALTEAGIPANDITKDMVANTAKTIGGEVTKSYAKESPNPINSPFLKNNPEYLEQPAYIEVELSNPYDKPTLPGSFNIDVEWPWREDITVNNITGGGSSSDQLHYITHFVHGLKRGNTGGYPIGYPIFQPVRSQPIPWLKSGEKRVVRIYLQPYTGKPYPFAAEGDEATERDFINMYNGHFGKAEFSVYTNSYELPDPKAVAKAQGFKEDGDHIYSYQYDRLSSGGGFTQDGNASWQP